MNRVSRNISKNTEPSIEEKLSLIERLYRNNGAEIRAIDNLVTFNKKQEFPLKSITYTVDLKQWYGNTMPASAFVDINRLRTHIGNLYDDSKLGGASAECKSLSQQIAYYRRQCTPNQVATSIQNGHFDKCILIQRNIGDEITNLYNKLRNCGIRLSILAIGVLAFAGLSFYKNTPPEV